MVKYIRNNFLLPEGKIVDLDHFNQDLWSWAEEDRDRIHYEKHRLQSELFEEESGAWLALPQKDFECARY